MRHSDCRLKELKTAAKAEEEALEAEPDHQAVDPEFFFFPKATPVNVIATLLDIMRCWKYTTSTGPDHVTPLPDRPQS